MPLTLRKRDSGRAGKESKKASNNVGANGDVSKQESSSSSVPENSIQETKIISSQESAKDNPGTATATEDPSDDSMKSIVGRSKHHPKLDPDSSSLGQIETGKEAKERDKNRASWVKTIGMRTLRLRKHGDSKSGKSVQNILAAVENDSGNNAATAGATGIPPSPSASSSLTEPGDTSTITKGHKKNVKKSSSSASTNLNGATLSTGSTPSTPTATGMDGSTTNKSSSGPAGNPATEDSNHDKQDPARFAGDGMSFKAKLIGILEVSGPRGDRICQEALSELKMAVKAAGEHKQKITLHVALDGLRIRDEKTGDCLYHHQVHKISFIAQDLTDTRAFGYIFGSPDMGHRFFGIKTEKAASQVVMAMRDLFQVVFDMKKKEIERAKQQLEMQQKYLATRAATEHTQKVEHKTSSIAETYIEGACALTTDSRSKAGGGAAAVPEVDLLNLEVELCSLQEGLENIHNNFSESVPFRGSTASISSDPMNPNKFSTSGYPGSTGGGAFSSDPFGDSFDPFDSSGTGFNQGAAATAASTNHHSSSMNFPSADPFAQVDPFPTPKFSNIEDSSGFFNTSSDPFDTPVGNFSFSFANDSAGSSGLNDSTASHDRAGFFNATGALVGSRFSGEVNAPRTQQQRSSSAMADGITPQESAATTWQASFDDNFVPGNANGSMLPLDIFTELDPLGTGRVRPFVDRKDFFQDLKNPPRKTLKDLYPSEQGLNTSQDEASLFPAAKSSPKLSSKVSRQAATAANTENSSALTNSFSTNFNPVPVGFDSAFKSALHASSMSKAHKAQVITGLSSSSSGKRGDSTTFRSDSPPNYNPPAPPTEANSFTNNEYFATPSTKSSSSVAPPPLLPPPSSASSNSPSLSRATKKSPQLLRQMTIGVPNSGSASMSPKTLPRNARFGKQSTIDISSADEMSPIPNLTPPPRPPHGTLNKNVTLSTAVPRPYSGDKSKSKLATSGSTTSGGSSFAMVRPFGAPEPPPRPLQTTMITSSSASPSSQQQQLPIVSPPPLPPKKTSLGPALSTGSSSVLSSKVLYTAEVNKKPETKENDLPLPLPSRKTASNTNSYNYHSSPSSNRYCVPPSVEPRYEFPETSTDEPQVPKMTMEQALLQVASLSLGQLAKRLDVPVEKLSNYTIQQLAEKLSFIGLEDESAKPPPPAPGKTQAFGSTSQISMRFESNFNTNFDDDNDISTVSAPAGFPPPKSAACEPPETSFDKYAVFRELAVEAASGFSVASSASLDNDSDDDRSRTQDRTLTGRDSSSERTLQVEHGASRQDVGGDASLALNTMDDITDANLSDDQDKFTLDDEEIDVGSGKWATFESNFEDSFAPVQPQKQQEVIISQPIKLDPPKKKPESPWDSDEDNNREPMAAAAAISISAFDDAKILQSLPPDPEEFDFQPFEKPAPITPPSAAASSVASTGRRSSREKDRGGFDSFKLEPKSSPSSSGGQFKRQSSGSSKNSLSKYSDYSDSGRHPRDERVRKNSRELLDGWDRRDWDGRDQSRPEETWDKEWGDGGGGDRWDRREGYSRRSDRDFDVPETKDDGRRHRGDDWADRRAELSRSDSRGSHSKRRHDRGYARDSDEDYSIGSRRDGSLRHSGGAGSGSRSRGGSARTREVQISRENLEIDDEEDEVDDDDRSYASHHSNYSSHSRRKHRRHPPRHNHYGGPPRRHRREYSPERGSNHESDFDDSCEEESTPRKRDHYERDYYGKPSPKYSGRGTGGGRPSSAGKRYEKGYRDYDRDYYRDRRDDGRYYHHRGRDYRRAEEVEDNNEEGVRGDREHSDYSCEDAPSYKSGSRRHRGRRPGGGGGSGSRNYYYNTNSPSWDSDSPEREGSGDRRKLRFGNGKQPVPRGRALSPRSTKIPKKPGHRFDDDFAGPPDPEIAAGDSFDSFQSDRPPKEPEDLTKSLPPQSPFEDNFVVQVNQQQGGAFDSNNIEFKRTAAIEDHFGTTGSTASGDVFFPAKFDVELEVEKEAANIAMRPLESSSSMTPIPTPSSADLTRSSPSFLTGKRLESIRSEEERLESSEDGADVGKGGDDDDDDGNTAEIRKEADIAVSGKEEGKPVLKKSDSFNIFNQEKDPFADDDFFQ